MMTKDNISKRLKGHSSDTLSKWQEKANWRMDNRSWLKYSQRIAMMMLDKMEELGLTQKSVAERMGCSQQYISRVLKGKENLSIEIISKIDEVLELEILEQLSTNKINKRTIAAMKEAETSDTLDTLNLSNFRDFIDSL